MKTHHSYKKSRLPISMLPGIESRNRKSMAGPSTMQLLQMEERVNQSNRVQRLELLQRKAEDFLIQREVLQLDHPDKVSRQKAPEFVPSPKAAIHVHVYPGSDSKLKGHLTLGATDIKVNSYFSALHALKTLRANPGVPDFETMECILKGWLDEFSPSIESTTEEDSKKKKHEDKDEDPKTVEES